MDVVCVPNTKDLSGVCVPDLHWPLAPSLNVEIVAVSRRTPYNFRVNSAQPVFFNLGEIVAYWQAKMSQISNQMLSPIHSINTVGLSTESTISHQYVSHMQTSKRKFFFLFLGGVLV